MGTHLRGPEPHPNSAPTYLFKEGMNKKDVLKAAKDAGADKATLKRLKAAMKSDSDKKVSNNVEAAMLQSIFNPKQKMGIAVGFETLYSDGNSAQKTTEYGDGSELRTIYNSSGNVMSTGYYSFGDNGDYSQLIDENGDNIPDQYVEVDSNGNKSRHIDLAANKQTPSAKEQKLIEKQNSEFEKRMNEFSKTANKPLNYLNEYTNPKYLKNINKLLKDEAKSYMNGIRTAPLSPDIKSKIIEDYLQKHPAAVERMSSRDYENIYNIINSQLQ